MIKQFLNIQNIVSILACVGVFFMATKIESCRNKSELHRLDKIIANKDKEIEKYEGRRKTDSTTIKELGLKIFSLEQDLDICNSNTPKRETVIAQQKSQLSDCQKTLKHGIDEGIIYCDTLFLKPVNLLKSGYYKVVPKSTIVKVVD